MVAIQVDEWNVANCRVTDCHRASQGRVFGLIGLIDGQKKCSGLGCINKEGYKTLIFQIRKLHLRS